MDTLKKQYIYFDSKDIAKPDIMWGALELGLSLKASGYRVDIDYWNEEGVKCVCDECMGIDIVITQNFSVEVAEACHRMNKLYISWVYDSPQRALYRKEALYETNYIFIFDKSEAMRLSLIGIKHIYHLPLAANITSTGMLNISDDDVAKYGGDIAFVGALYKSGYMNGVLGNMSEKVRTSFDDWIDARKFNWRQNILGNFDKAVIDYLWEIFDKEGLKENSMPFDYACQVLVGAKHLTYLERVTLINEANKLAKTNFFTRDKVLSGIEAKICDPVRYEDEMYKVFFSTKINLNITYRAITSGIPQRIMDIMAMGGFVLTNYQPEIDLLFMEGANIVEFRDMEDYKRKLDYYLTHDDERIRIGINGYKTVKEKYNYPGQILKILKCIENCE